MITATGTSKELKQIAEKVKSGERITDEEGLLLFEKASLGFVGSLANYVREKLHGDKTYFNRNFHIEPTNVCVFSCNFLFGVSGLFRWVDICLSTSEAK